VKNKAIVEEKDKKIKKCMEDLASLTSQLKKSESTIESA
jgi:hypothetical protein